MYILLLLTLASATAGDDLSCGVVSKASWGGVAPSHVEYLPRPVGLVIIQHTVTPECTTEAACKEIVRNIQNDHVNNREFWDIGPSFLVGGDGRVYEGAGWTRVGAHTYEYNRKSIGITFIGNFSRKLPTASAMNAAKSLIECGVSSGHLTRDYDLVGHRQLVAIESPGLKLYDKIKTWPHWLRDVAKYKK